MDDERDDDIDEQKLIRELIEHDKTLTPEQRCQEGDALRLHRFRLRLKRMQKLLEIDAPGVILANESFGLFRAAWALWEEGMQHAHGKWLQEIFRKQSARCVICAADLPLPYTREDCCPKCIKDCEQLAKDSE